MCNLFVVVVVAAAAAAAAVMAKKIKFNAFLKLRV
jgi:hypothetical protein